MGVPLFLFVASVEMQLIFIHWYHILYRATLLNLLALRVF